MRKNRTRHAKATKTITQRARQLRQRHTKAEEHLWLRLRGRKLSGIKFRRQHPIASFIVDFCCVYVSLIVEIDGDIHDHQQTRDAERTAQLESLGFRVIRFRNEDVLFDTERVLDEIETYCRLPKTPFCKEPTTSYLSTSQYSSTFMSDVSFAP